MEQERLITRQEVAEMSGVSKAMVDKLRRAGILRTYLTIGGRHRFYLTEVKAHFGLEEQHAQ